MNAVVDPGGAISSDNSDLDKKEPVVALKKQKSISNVEGKEKHFDIPLSIFRYKGYDSDFFTSWYNILKEIFEEIREMCPEKRVLNLALSVLMLPYIASISLGLVVYSRSKADGKIQTSLEGNKTKKSEVSESTAKRLAYSVLAAIAILVNIVVLVTLIIPATLALATFYLLNKKLSHSLVATVKIGSGLYKNEHQNIEVSFHEVDAGESDIRWDMEIKFPPQFEQLLRDLCEDKNDRLFVTQDAEHNTILKLSANIHLKNGLVPLRNEIRSMLATSIQGFTEAMGELLKLDKKDITYDKLKELLNEFRLRAVNSVNPELTSHLIQDAYRVAFIQAIKFAQQRRKEGFSLEERVKEVLVEQELKSQGKELPTEKEIIIKDLKELKKKRALDLADEDITSDNGFPVLKAVWKQLIKEGKIAKRTIIDDYRNVYPEETAEALRKAEVMIKELKGMGEKRYEEICEELRKIHGDIGKNNLKDSALKRKLEDLFKFEYGDQEVEKRLIRSVIKRAKGELRQSDILNEEKLSLIGKLKDLEKKINEKTSEEVNDFIAKMYLEITKCRIQSLFKEQAKGIERSCKLLKKDAPDLVAKINLHRKEVEDYLKSPKQSTSLKAIIEENEDLNKYLEDERNSKGKEHPNTELIEQHLQNNQQILKALENLEPEKEGLLINEETKNDYREELTSREKIKFAIIEDKLLKIIKASSEDELLKIVEEAFSEGELLEIKETSKDKPLEIIRQVAIKKLLEKAELEYCLAERCIKYPVIKTKDNIKHFCQDLLSPLIGNLVEKIINHIPKNISKDTESNWIGRRIYRKVIEPLQIVWNCNKLGLSAIGNENSTEGKALKVAHDTYKEVETFLQYFESSYKEVGGLIGNVFSDDGETFKRDIWPKIKDHLCEMWDRFFKDIEFTLISKDESKNVSRKLNEVNVAQLQQEALAV
ncbi:MAG: hypothetical protein KTV72_00640 [Wolbachia endosymbiont of Melophagus ovinus]|nr:hypothetical protein [Wolbachia endosymbiont of Melophagus ovinus]